MWTHVTCPGWVELRTMSRIWVPFLKAWILLASILVGSCRRPPELATEQLEINYWQAGSRLKSQVTVVSVPLAPTVVHRMVLVPAGSCAGTSEGKAWMMSQFELSRREWSVVLSKRIWNTAEELDLPMSPVQPEIDKFLREVSDRVGRRARFPNYQEWRCAVGPEAEWMAVDPRGQAVANFRPGGSTRPYGSSLWKAGSGQPNRLGFHDLLGNLEERVVVDKESWRACGGHSDQRWSNYRSRGTDCLTYSRVTTGLSTAGFRFVLEGAP